MNIRICGIPYRLKYEDVIDENEEGIICGKIIPSKNIIKLKKGMTTESEREVLIHEMVHGILNHLGKSELSCDEEFVQLMANAIYNHFEIRDDIYEEVDDE